MKKLLSALALAAAFNANAGSLQIDLTPFTSATFDSGLYSGDLVLSNDSTQRGGDPDWLTQEFSAFSLSLFEPKSTYLDTDNSGSVSTGDLVVDSGSTIVGSFNPVETGNTSEFYNSYWNLGVSWDLFGVAGVNGGIVGEAVDDLDDVVGAQFVGGLITFSFIGINGDEADNFVEDVFTMSVTGSSAELGNDLLFALYGEINEVFVEDFLFANDKDVSDIIGDGSTVQVRATTTIEGSVADLLSPDTNTNLTAEQIAGLQQYFNYDYTQAPATLFSRTTELDNVNIELVPAPGQLGLLGLGFLALALRARSKK